MRHIVFYLALSLLTIGCGTDTKKKNTKDSSNTEVKNTVEYSKVSTSNYAVVWKWATTNSQLISDNSDKISEELTNLWKEGIVENVYYDSDPKQGELSNFPNISFFIKAEDKQAASVILNKLTVVNNGIASYKLFPVGHLWLDRKFKTIHEKGLTKSYVAVWNTPGKPSTEITKKQSDKTLELWNEGIIENVYFDIEGTQNNSAKTDFVFYINTNSEEEAKEICDSFPFSKENIASYQLHPVGVFWMGIYQKK